MIWKLNILSIKLLRWEILIVELHQKIHWIVNPYWASIILMISMWSASGFSCIIESYIVFKIFRNTDTSSLWSSIISSKVLTSLQCKPKENPSQKSLIVNDQEISVVRPTSVQKMCWLLTKLSKGTSKDFKAIIAQEIRWECLPPAKYY